MNTLYVILGAALIPLVIGFIWYNPKVLGTAWMEASGMTKEKMEGANMGLIFGLSYLFSVMLSLAMLAMVIHQVHLNSIFIYEPGFGEAGSEIDNLIRGIMEKYGTNFRTFRHGAFHGTVGGILLSLPIIGTNAIFERKGFKYIAINVGYWVVCMILMGGVICQFADIPNL